MTITNPCEAPTWLPSSTAISSSGPVDGADPTLALLTVSSGTSTTFTLEYPKLLESQTYGVDAYSLCGEREVYLIDQDGGGRIEANGRPYSKFPYVSLTANLKPNDFKQRSFTVRFESNSEFDYGLHEFLFTQGLKDYPFATPWNVNLNVRIEPCVVTAFTAPSDLEVTYTVGDPLKTISYFFD